MAASTVQDNASSSELSADDVSDVHANSTTVTSLEIGMAQKQTETRTPSSDQALTERVLCDMCNTPNDVLYNEKYKVNLCPTCFHRHGLIYYKDDNKDKADSSSNESGDDVPDANSSSTSVTSIQIGLAHMRIQARMRESNPAMTERVLCDICDTPKDAFLYCEECKVNLCSECLHCHDNSHHVSVPYCPNKAEALAQLPQVEDELAKLYQEEECLQWKGKYLENIKVGSRREREAYMVSSRRLLKNRLEAIDKERKDLQKKHAELKQICQTPAEQLWKRSGVSVTVLDDDKGAIYSRRPATPVFEHRMEEHATRTTGTVVCPPQMYETNRTRPIPWPRSHPRPSTVQGAYRSVGRDVTSLPTTVPVDLTHLSRSLRYLQESVSNLHQTTTWVHSKVSDLEERHLRLVLDVSKLQENTSVVTFLSAMQDQQDAQRGAVAIMALQNEHLVSEIVSLKEETGSLSRSLLHLKKAVSRMETNLSGAGQNVAKNDVARFEDQPVEDGETETNADQRVGEHDLAGTADQPEQTSS